MIRKSLFPKDLQNIIIGYCRWKYMVERKKNLVGLRKGKIVFYWNFKDLVIAKMYSSSGKKIYVNDSSIDIGGSSDNPIYLWHMAPYNSSQLISILSRYSEEERKVILQNSVTEYRLLLYPKK